MSRILAGAVTILALCVPVLGMKVRNMKPGDVLPRTEQSAPLLMEQDRVIVFVNSSAARTLRFLKLAGPEIRRTGTSLLVVDTASEPLESCRKLTASFGGTVIPDADKTLYGMVGIIVLPTALFVRADHVLNSALAGVRPNLTAFVKSHLAALKNHAEPKDPFADAEKQVAARAVNRELTQAFNMLQSGGAQLARSLYEKVLKSHPDNVDAMLGAGYACIMMDDMDGALTYFNKLLQQDGKSRYRFGQSLASYEKAPGQESLAGIREHFRFEPDFFMVVARAAALLDQAGQTEAAGQAWRHAYRVLRKRCRRQK